LLVLTPTAQFPSLQKLLGLIERKALFAHRRHNIRGTKQRKATSSLLDGKFQPTGQCAHERLSFAVPLRSVACQHASSPGIWFSVWIEALARAIAEWLAFRDVVLLVSIQMAYFCKFVIFDQ
jgi:hypothetical protein